MISNRIKNIKSPSFIQNYFSVVRHSKGQGGIHLFIDHADIDKVFKADVSYISLLSLATSDSHHGNFRGERANTRQQPNVDLMLDQRRRRWSNIKSTLGQCFMLAW